MKCLIVAVFAFIAAVQAIPYGGYGLGGELGLGGGYSSGGGYGDSGFAGGNNGYQNEGYGSNGINMHHNIGHAENDYDAAVHHHSSSGHDIGGMTAVGSGGHNMAGYDGYGMGHNNYGNGWNNGYMI